MLASIPAAALMPTHLSPQSSALEKTEVWRRNSNVLIKLTLKVAVLCFLTSHSLTYLSTFRRSVLHPPGLEIKNANEAEFLPDYTVSFAS